MQTVRTFIISILLITGLPQVSSADVHIIEKKRVSLDFYGNLFLQAGETAWTFQANEIGSYSEKNHLWSPAAGMRLGLRSVFSDKLQLDLAIHPGGGLFLVAGRSVPG